MCKVGWPRRRTKKIMAFVFDKSKLESLSSENFENVIFYKDNSELLVIPFRNISKHTIKNGRISEEKTYGDTLVRFDLNSLKKANKINLSRKDCYYAKSVNGLNRYSHNYYDLYIYVDDTNVKFQNLGEYISLESCGETDYKEVYKITLPSIHWKHHNYKRIECENYTLADGERWSEYGFGSDEEHACVSPYDTTGYEKSLFRNGARPSKGIVKRWFSYSCEDNDEIIVTSNVNTRVEKNPERLERERIANVMSDVLRNSISHYDVESLLKVVDIHIKEGV